VPELTAPALRDSCRFSREASSLVSWGSPSQSHYVGCFDSLLGDELAELFCRVTQPQVLIEDSRQERQPLRPDSPLGSWPECRAPSATGRRAGGHGTGDLRSPYGVATFDVDARLTIQSPTDHQLSQRDRSQPGVRSPRKRSRTASSVGDGPVTPSEGSVKTAYLPDGGGPPIRWRSRRNAKSARA
jgi:hypothetical protein